MQRINPDEVATLLIPNFLCELMGSERERLGLDPKDASAKAGWPSALWGALERGARPLEREQWIAASDALGLEPSDIVKHFDTFIAKNPTVWVEMEEGHPGAICERPMTSPRAIHSSRLASVDLNPIRPVLFHELSEYSARGADIVAAAVSLNIYTAREVSIIPSALPTSPVGEVERRERIIRIIQEMSPEKFGLFERVVDKFSRYSSKQLAVAYQHFSISIKNR